MLEFSRQLVSFPWAISLFGIQQIANFPVAGDGKREDSAADSLYVVSQAAQMQLNSLLWAAYQVGDSLQKRGAELAWDAVSLQAFTPSYATKLGQELVGQSSEAIADWIPGEASALSFQTFLNNYNVFNLVKNNPVVIPSDGPLDLEFLIEQAYAVGEYGALWAVEGLGHDYAQTFWGRKPVRGILTEGQGKALPPKSLTMMHAGLGLLLAEKIMPAVTPHMEEGEVAKILNHFIHLVEANARVGYHGAAFESLGLVTRTWHQEVVSVVDRVLTKIRPEVAEFFWHGVGRALYFLPIHFVPGFPSAWQAAKNEPPHDWGRRNAIAGLSWATALVNLKQPAILARVLQRGYQSAQDDAFTNGVMSAMIMAADVNPHDIYLKLFLQYEPDGALADRWNTLVRQPVERALKVYYPLLKNSGSLGSIFHYQSLEALAGKMPSGGANG